MAYASEVRYILAAAWNAWSKIPEIASMLKPEWLLKSRSQLN